MDKTDKIKQEEFPLPRYVQEVLSKHNISLPSLWGRGKGEGLLGRVSELWFFFLFTSPPSNSALPKPLYKG